MRAEFVVKIDLCLRIDTDRIIVVVKGYVQIVFGENIKNIDYTYIKRHNWRENL